MRQDLRLRWVVVPMLALAGCADTGGGAGTDSDSGSEGSAGEAGSGGSTAGTTGTTTGSGSASGSSETSGSSDGGTSSGSSDGGSETGTGGGTHDCDDPDPAWLLCEDFEDGAGDFDVWRAGSAFVDGVGLDDRGRIDLASDQVHGGSWSVVMPAEEGSGFQGASLDWFACDGEPATNCPLRSFERLYFRTWLRFREDHDMVHHFLTIGGSQPDDFWYHGTAGCLPDGTLEMSTTVDFSSPEHEAFFYQYHPDMQCDLDCANYADVASICQDCADKGLPTCDQQQQCCWGENLTPPEPVVLPLGQWFCMELTMEANTPGEADGTVSFAVDDVPGHTVTDLRFRDVPELALNRIRVQHYITTEDAAGHSNVVWFDDVVVSTEPIGCD